MTTPNDQRPVNAFLAALRKGRKPALAFHQLATMAAMKNEAARAAGVRAVAMEHDLPFLVPAVTNTFRSMRVGKDRVVWGCEPGEKGRVSAWVYAHGGRHEQVSMSFPPNAKPKQIAPTLVAAGTVRIATAASAGRP